MNPTSPGITQGVDPAQVRGILRRHRPFMFVAALGIAGLYAEEAWATAQFWPRLSSGSQSLLGILIVLFALVGNAIAFLAPPVLVRPEDYPRPVGAFAQAFFLGAAISVVAGGLDLLLLLMLSGLDINASYILLKDVYFYILVVILIHGLVYYVRHMHWLYDNFGGADSPLKPIAATGGVAAMIFIITIVFMPMDLQGVNAAPAALRGLTGLHLYGRDLYLLSLALGAFAWHLRWIADH